MTFIVEEFIQHQFYDYYVFSAVKPTSLEQYETLGQAMKSLTPEQPFASFDLGLTENEVEFLNKLEICRNMEEGVKGKDHNGLSRIANSIVSAISCPDDLRVILAETDSLLVQAKEIATNTAKLIYKVVNNVMWQLPKYELDGFEVRVNAIRWVETGISWHRDGPEEIRVVFTLKGPSTLFCPPTALFCPPTYVWHGLEYINILSVISDEFKDSAGRGHVFLANEATHSSPPTKDERIFVRMVLREKEQNIIS